MSDTESGYILLLTQGHAGDRLGARLAPALQEQLPEMRLVGLGGEGMRAAGVQLIARTDRLSAMGWTGLLPKVPAVLSSILRAARHTKLQPPACVIAVDTWQPLKALHRFAPHLVEAPHVCYLPPGPNFIGRTRVHDRAAALFHTLLTPFPHQERLFTEAGGRVRPAAHAGMQALREQHQALAVKDREPILALLPGSRSAEVRYGLPPQWAAAQEVLAAHPELRPVICCADESIAAVAGRVAPGVETAPNAREVLAKARFGLMCSGTAVLEAALLGCPGVVTYHGSPLQRWEWERFHVPGLAKLREAGIASPYIALPNIISGQALYPELIGEPSPVIAAAALAELRRDPREVRSQLDAVAEALYWNDAGEAVAGAVREAINPRS